MNTKTPQDVLVESPGLIRSVEVDQWAHKVALENIQKKLKETELEKMVEVTAILKPDGKPLHSNADSRAIAVMTLLREDTGFQELCKMERDVRHLLDEARIQLDYLRDTMRNARYLVLDKAPLGSVLMSLEGHVNA